MTSVMEPYEMNENALKLRVHCMEREAYGAVLKAFIFQSDLLSWGKEGLMTDLRKELNITDDEHRDLLSKIDSDEAIGVIRELRKQVSSGKRLLSDRASAPSFIYVPVKNVPDRRLKVSCGSRSTYEMNFPHEQPSSASKPSENVPNRRLKISCDPRKTYDIEPPSVAKPVEYVSDRRLKAPYAPRTTSEMVFLHGQPSSAMSPMENDSDRRSKVQFKDVLCHGQTTKYLADVQKPSKPLAQNSQVSATKGGGPVGSDLKRGLHPVDRNAGSRPNVIEIRATDKLLRNVEKAVFGRGSHDPRLAQKAKVVLREQEQAILEALKKLAPLLDGDDDRNQFQHQHSQRELTRLGRGLVPYGEIDRTNSCC